MGDVAVGAAGCEVQARVVGAAARPVGAVEGGSDEIAGNRILLSRLIERVRSAGYATNDGEWKEERHIAAIAMPIRPGGRVVGCLNVVFLRQAMGLDQAESLFVDPLREIVNRIEVGAAELIRP